MNTFRFNDYVKLAHDVYFPRVNFFKPDEEDKNSPDNKKDYLGFYPNSSLKFGDQWERSISTLLPSPEAKDGFYAAFYRHKIHKQHGVIAFRGSDDYLDFIWHDSKISVGEWPKIALQHAINFHTFIKQNYTVKTISLTGHSLGGALAQLVAHELNKNCLKAAHDKVQAICFNAPQMGYLFEHNPHKRENSALNINNLVTQEQDNIKNFLNHHTHDQKTNIVPLLLSNLRFIGKTADILRHAYSSLINIKDLNLCPSSSQPAFNAVYQMLKMDKQDYLLNKVNFEQSEKEAIIKYPYIINCNALYDFVHTVGMRAGFNLTIDTDKHHQPSNARLRSELRVSLTTDPDYLYHKSQFLVINKPHEECRVSIEKRLLHKQDLNEPWVLGAIDYFANNKSDLKNDLSYLMSEQHDIAKIAYAIDKRDDLKNLSPHSHKGSLQETFNERGDKYTKPKDLNYILEKTGLIKKVKKEDCVKA